jgi:hypothetical protein
MTSSKNASTTQGTELKFVSGDAVLLEYNWGKFVQGG